MNNTELDKLRIKIDEIDNRKKKKYKTKKVTFKISKKI